MGRGFRITWAPGSSAQIDLFSPGKKERQFAYRLKYTPAFRSIFRRGVEDNPVGENELENTNAVLEKLVQVLGTRAQAAAAVAPEEPEAPKPRPAPPPLKEVGSETRRQMEKVGERLIDLIIPRKYEIELRSPDLFIELGLDEELMKYPWELMFDGDFLCMKHALGRFVNGEEIYDSQRKAGSLLDRPLDKLSVLLISVPKPNVRPDGTVYDSLPEAEAETKEILDVLGDEEDVEVDVVGEPTWDNVVRRLKSRTYQIIHFNGHAHFNPREPHNSGIVLLDRDMSAIDVKKYFPWNPAVLYFINACETATTGGAPQDDAEGGNGKGGEARDRFNLLDLARALIEGDAYTLGSRWKINDKAAAKFAGTFYRELIANGTAIGHAIRLARVESRDDDDFAWASYVYYGDPRISFRRC